MASSGLAWPPEEQARDIYSRLADDDPTAASDLANAFLEPLAIWLERTNPRIDEHICGTAAEDAILSLIKNPRSFKPDRQRLEVYLRMSATMDLRNLLRAESRHRKRRATLELVELSPSDRKFLQDPNDPASIVEQAEEQRIREIALSPPPIPDKVRSSLTPGEAEVLNLMRIGERKTAVFAAVLGISALPTQAQRDEVKRTKDRIKRRLERAGGSDDQAT